MENKPIIDESKALSHGNIKYGATLSQDDQLTLDQFEIRKEKKDDDTVATDYDTGLHHSLHKKKWSYHIDLCL